jgi:WD40 repeat protein/tRNA A-37 threonylcarbamoyl transferase component Bud32
MTDPTPDVKSLFGQALERPTAERAAFLDAACADHPAVRAELDALLAALDRAGGFLNPPASPAKDEATRDAPAADSAATRSFAAEERPGVLVAGRYKLLQRIGEGGMGTVWMADQVEPVKRRVAVKLIREERGNSKTILSRFEAERQAIALMDHPHIAKLLDAGTSEAGQPFFVMELVKGVPLTDYCDAHRLSIPDRLTLFAQICSAVQHAHQKGVIHRDLKPTNILVESHDGRAVPKVIDFGLAKATSGLQLTEQTLFTAFGSVMGTPLYMAPEQATFNAVDVDTRADVYALGVILYELLCGTTPLTRETVKRAALDEMLKLIREQEAPPPSSRLSATDARPSIAANRQTEPAKLSRLMKGELDWIVLRALAKERERRYESAAALARDVGRHLTGEAVEACPPTLGYRLRKAYRRNKAAVWVSTAFTLLMTVGVAVASLLAVRARDAEAVAKANADQASTNEAAALRAEAETKQERDRVAASERTLARTLYASRLNSLQIAYDANDVERAIQIHQSMIPKPGEADLRGFEWHYWARQFRTDKTFFAPPETGGSASCFVSPDGTRIGVVRRAERPAPPEDASARRLGTWLEERPLATLEMYDAATGKPISDFRSPRIARYGDALPVASQSFSSDGKSLHLILGKTRDIFGPAEKSELRFCAVDTNTGQVLADKALPQHLNDGFVLLPNNLKFSRDRTVVALVAQKGFPQPPERGQHAPKQPVKVEIESRIELRRWPDGTLIRKTQPFPEKVGAVALSPDGSRVVVKYFRNEAATASAKTYSFQIFHGPEWAEQTTIEEPNVSTVQLAAGSAGLEFSRDGELVQARVPIGNGNLGVVSWDATHGKRKGNPIKVGEEGQVIGLPMHRFSPDGLYLAVHRSSTVEVYTVSTGKLYSKLKVTSFGLETPEWTADSKRLYFATGYPRATFQSWSVDTLPRVDVMPGAVGTSALGQLLRETVMGATREGKWLLRKEHLPARQRTEPETYLHAFIATRLDDPNAAEVKFPVVGGFSTSTALVGDHFAVAYDVPDKALPAGRERARLAVVDLQFGRSCFDTSIERFSPGLTSPPVLSPYGRYVGMGWRGAKQRNSQSGMSITEALGPWTFRLWDTKTGESLWERQLPTGAWGGANFSPDGNTLGINVGESVLLLDTVTGEERRRFEHPIRESAGSDRADRVKRVEFTPDGKRIAVWWVERTANDKGRLMVYDTTSGGLVSRTDAIAPPTSMLFHPDGVRLLASGKLIDTEIGQVMMDFPAGGLLGWTEGGRKLLGLNPGVGEPRKWLFEIDATPLK